MTIVLNEHEWAEEMINSRTLGKKPYETMCRVARYYIDKGYSKRDTRKLLEAFLIQCEPSASIPKWDDLITHSLERALKYKAIDIDHISITRSELDAIASLKNKQTQRLAFTLLCLAKYWDVVNPNGNHWVNNKDSDIMRMANINTSIKRQSEMYHTLHSLGLIQFSKKVDNTNVRVCFMGEDEPVLFISDFRNLGYQYLKYRGEPYFVCQNCGITTKYNNANKGREQKYCAPCAVEVATRQRVNSVMRIRKGIKK